MQKNSQKYRKFENWENIAKSKTIILKCTKYLLATTYTYTWKQNNSIKLI